MNLATILALAVLLLWLFVVLRRIKRKKAAAFACGGDCSKCLAGCAYRRQAAGEKTASSGEDKA